MLAGRTSALSHPTTAKPRGLDPDDPIAADAAAGGERLVARIRLWLVLVLLAIHALTSRPAPPHPVRWALVCALAVALLAYGLARRPHGRWLAFASSGLDVSLVTAPLLLHALEGDPQAAINNPMVFEVYFLVLAIASLRFDWHVCAFTGLLALAQYGCLAAWVDVRWGLPELDPSRHANPILSLNVQFARLVLLATATAVACAAVFRARHLRERLAEAVRSAERHERAQQLAVLEERQRLARDLHDSVTQLLFSVTLVAQSIAPAWRRDAREGEGRVQRLLELTQSALREMRALLGELRPNESVLELVSAESALVGISRIRREGLPGALRRHAADIGGDGLAVEVDDAGYEAQPLEREEVLYRIAQEALTNVAKHARARSARVVLAAHDDAVTLSVSDAGRGFDAVQARARAWSGPQSERGFGLVSMRERVEALRGVFRIVSAPGRGTTVSVELPRGANAPGS